MASFLKLFSGFLVIFTIVFVPAFAQEDKEDTTAETIEELQVAIEKVLADTKTPAVGIAMVNADGPEWITSLGKANVEDNIDADENTMFRIGSTSKMFVSLAILQLVEENSLDLLDRVRDLVPDLEFENPWADEHPIRIVHLLEHTTGWDDIHTVEYAYQPDPPVTLKEGLAFHPHSRISRWAPGSRMSYCNSGPPVAAYIVEAVTGQKFEDYIQEHFFDPMGMENATYFKTETYEELGATLYEDGEPAKYWEIIMRPSGSINASPKDMAKLVTLFVKRGMVNDSVRLITEGSLIRMETPSSTNGAKAGVQEGYGLSNYSSYGDGFRYRGHNGGVNGGLCDLAYNPGQNKGYIIIINSGSGVALRDISKLIRNYQMRGVHIPKIINDIKMTEQHEEITGYYEHASPRNSMFHFLNRIPNIKKFWCENDTIYQTELMGDEIIWYLPASKGRYKSVESGMVRMALVTDPLDGLVLQDGSRTLKPVSVLVVYGRLLVLILWIVLLPLTLVLALIWIIRYFTGQIAKGPNVQVRLWPLITTFFAIAILVSGFMVVSDPFEVMTTANSITVSLMLLTYGFAITSIWSMWTIIKFRPSGTQVTSKRGESSRL